MNLYLKFVLCCTLYVLGLSLMIYYTRHRERLNLHVLFGNNRVLIMYTLVALIVPPYPVYLISKTFFSVVKYEYYDTKANYHFRKLEKLSDQIEKLTIDDISNKQ